MRLSYIISILIILVAVAYSTFRYASVSGLPPTTVHIVSDVIDLGSAREMREINSHFSIINGSEHDYVLTNIETTCSCTIPEKIWPTVIKSGQALDVPFLFETARGDGVRHQKVFAVFQKKGDHDAKPLVRAVNLICEIEPELRAKPRILDLGTIGPGENNRSASFVVSSVSGVSYTIESIRPQDRRFTITGPNRIDLSGTDFSISFDSSSNLRREFVRTSVVFELSGGHVEDFEIPVKVQVEPEFAVTPELIVFPAGSTAGAKTTVQISSKDRFEIRDLILASDFFDVRAKSNKTAALHDLEVTLKSESDEPLGGHFRLTLVKDQEVRKIIRIEVERLAETMVKSDES